MASFRVLQCFGNSGATYSGPNLVLSLDVGNPMSQFQGLTRTLGRDQSVAAVGSQTRAFVFPRGLLAVERRSVCTVVHTREAGVRREDDGRQPGDLARLR